jgi:serine/threonine protein kinase
VDTANPSVSDAEAEVGPGGAEPTGPVRLKQGDTVGSRFVIDERLRDDALGTVYRAVDDRSGKKIAILMFGAEAAGDAVATERLRKSVKAATELAHKNIVGVYGMGKEGRRRYLAREYVDGQTLSELLEKKAEAGKAFTLKGAYNLVAHVCNALQHARATMPHGTLRPSCVLINRTGRVKVADFGLGELRASLSGQREALSRWDAPCLPADGAPSGEEGIGVADDLRALGTILYELLAGAPPAQSPPALPENVAKRLPPAIAGILERCFAADEAQRFRDPNELKTALLEVIEAARGAGLDERDLTPGASVEMVEEILAASVSASAPKAAPPPPGRAAPRKAEPPARKRADDGGFVIPELKPSVSATEDDGTTQRWLIEREGIDYGPFSTKQVIEQLFKEELSPDATLYDIEQDRRAPLSEFNVFDETLVAWGHEKAERQKRQAEEAARAAAVRRKRLVLGAVLGTLLLVGGTGGGYAWYRATRPVPVKAYLPTLVTRIQTALPAVRLPEELPETPAEVEEKRKAAVAVATQQRQRAEAARAAAQIAEEERLMNESAVLNLNAQDGGRRFDRPSFDAAVARRNQQLTRCLQDEVRRDPSLKSLEVKVTVIPRGDLINVRLGAGSSAGNACVRAALAGLKVPPFDGTNLTVSLPFSFQR